MAEKFIQCPEDPKMEYLLEVCENVFRKNEFRSWCLKCKNFNPTEQEGKDIYLGGD